MEALYKIFFPLAGVIICLERQAYLRIRMLLPPLYM